jgi:hypothetical protein
MKYTFLGTLKHIKQLSGKDHQTQTVVSDSTYDFTVYTKHNGMTHIETTH